MDELKRTTVTEDPPNRESPLGILLKDLTPAELFYIRSNFSVPQLGPEHRIDVCGAVDNALSFDLEELRSMESRDVTVTFECAGNARLSMVPVPKGTAWGWGAVSTARFTGVPLREILGPAGVAETAIEVAFRGADRGSLRGETIAFERSLPLDVALQDDVLVAWKMNGEPLPLENGAPVRVVVPRWYGVASVKWLERIAVLEQPLDAHFQTERYVYVKDPFEADQTPVTAMRVRSLIASPADGARLAPEELSIEGSAWSGSGAVTAVNISCDGGNTWVEAELGEGDGFGLARRWRLAWTPPGPGRYRLLSRATDAAGHQQPLEPIWNELGYGNNLAHRIEVEVA